MTMRYRHFDEAERWSLASHCGLTDDPFDGWCGQTYDGWVCTRKNGHRGRHEAGTYRNEDGFASIGAVW